MTTANSTISVTLGDRTFVVRPLTIGQLERVAEVSDLAAAAASTAKASIAMARKVVAIGLEKADPDAAQNDCDDLAATSRQLFAASRAIMVLSGLVIGDAIPGEAQGEPVSA